MDFGGLLSGLTGAVYELFGYNRKNFQYDRRQRTVMEYQLAEMRIQQVGLWRQDVRDAIELTPKKMEVYLLVIAIELTATACCLCKGRIPPGAPPWMVAAGVLAICSAISYLFLALWFGLHAFVAAQAYKVRILTQLVRLPIPSWTHMEACRTYGSDFESMNTSQMLRVPVVAGSQEGYVGQQTDAARAVDPWGLERSAEATPELHRDMNCAVERQRHVWLIREAAKFFNTYDAFCRVSMSAGTSSLATFFCFYCLAYVCTELAAPVAAWAGMFVFCGITLLLLRTDQILSARNYFVGSIFLFFSPVFCSVVTFLSSKHVGNPGRIEYLVPIGLFLKGCWFLYYLHVFHASEHQTGAVLPRSFRAVLYLDPYGWAKHTRQWLNRWRMGTDGPQYSVGSSNGKNRLPATLLAGARRPLRPEDARHEVSAVLQGPLVANPADLEEDDDEEEVHTATSMRPTSFLPNTQAQGDDQDPEAEDGSQEQERDKLDRAGLQPWSAFFFNTVLLCVMWWCASFVSFYDVYIDLPEFTRSHYGLKPGEVTRMATLQGEKMETGWADLSWQPHGFACGGVDHVVFAVAERSSSGSRLLQGQMKAKSVNFEAAPHCGQLKRRKIQDLSLRCKDAGCAAEVLPSRASELVNCPVTGNWSEVKGTNLAVSWLEDRGGAPQEEHQGLKQLLHPEEIAAVSSAPCPVFEMGLERQCMVVGTTAQRLVHMTLGKQLEDEERGWLPRRLLGRQADMGPGTITSIGNRFLGVLQKDSSVVILDLEQGGKTVGQWSLQQDGTGPGFIGLCSNQKDLYALQAGPRPSVWRFPHPLGRV